MLSQLEGGSKGIKFKNLRKILNKSLVEITIDFAKFLKITKFIAVSSDNKKILKLAKKKELLELKDLKNSLEI